MIKLTQQEIQSVVDGLEYSVWARQTYDYKHQETKFHLDGTPNQAVHAINTLRHQISEVYGELYRANEQNLSLKAELEATRAALNAIVQSKAKQKVDKAIAKTTSTCQQPEPKLWAPQGYVAHKSSGFLDCEKCAFDNDPVMCTESPCTSANHPQKVNVYYTKL